MTIELDGYDAGTCVVASGASPITQDLADK